MNWFKTVVVLAVLVGLGWLYYSPPVVTYGTPDEDIAACRPLGGELPGQHWQRAAATGESGSPQSVGFGSIYLRDNAVDEYIEDAGYDLSSPSVPQVRRDFETELLAACDDERTSRLAGLGVGIAVALTALILYRTRQREPLAESPAPEAPVPAEEPDASSTPDAGERA